VVNTNPSVSVIIPTYNHAHFLKRCLFSLIHQTYKDWEAIVINNFSEDNTIEVVKEFNEKRFYLVNFKNNGIIAASRNEGIRLAKGEYIAFLDSDDWWYPEKLAESMRFFLEGADVVYHDLDIYCEEKRPIRQRNWRRQLKKPVFNDLMIHWNTIPNSGVVVRKSIIDKVGGLSEDEELITFEDIELWIKIARVTDNFVYIPKRLGGYWQGESNLSKRNERHIKCIETIYERYLYFLEDKEKKQAEAHKAYLIGRIKQKMGFYRDALRLFFISLQSKNSGVKIKSFCLIPIVIFMAIFLKRR